MKAFKVVSVEDGRYYSSLICGYKRVEYKVDEWVRGNKYLESQSLPPLFVFDTTVHAWMFCSDMNLTQKEIWLCEYESYPNDIWFNFFNDGLLPIGTLLAGKVKLLKKVIGNEDLVYSRP